MKLIGNVIWFLILGLWLSIIYVAVGVVLCVSLIGIPVGLQFFKMARYAIWPLGRPMGVDFERHPILNLVWILLGGEVLATVHFTLGIVFALTIIGIPFAKVCFRLAKLSFLPFGATVA